LPAKFADWRPGQWDAVEAVLTADQRVSALCLPTGAGKSLVYMALTRLVEGRACVLVSTRGLQDQLRRDFGPLVHDLRGQQNYICLAAEPGGEHAQFHRPGQYKLACDEGPCHAGMSCAFKRAGCLYVDAYAGALESPLVLTNYACYLTSYLYKSTWEAGERIQGLGEFDTLILDEAHEAIDELTRALSIDLLYADIYRVLSNAHPSAGDGVQRWWIWAKAQVGRLETYIEGLAPSKENLRTIVHAKKLLRTLSAIVGRVTERDWLMQEGHDGIRFEPIDVADYTEQFLFRGASKIVLSSATVRPKTMEMLGVKKIDSHTHEAPSPFPVESRQVLYVPTVRVDNRATESDLRALVHRVDQIIRRRQDRKGIIHCTSYKRMELVLSWSEFRHLMLHHTSANARDVIARFKAKKGPCILVSPSVTTGYDFPYDECEYQILLKIPYPDTRPAIVKARTEIDSDYPKYLAMQTLVQTVGRGVRGIGDRCETFLLDDHATWFIPRNKQFSPRWFMEGYKRVEVIPAPAAKLA